MIAEEWARQLSDQELARAADALGVIVPYFKAKLPAPYSAPWRALEWRAFVDSIRPLERAFAANAMRAFVAIGAEAARAIRAGKSQDAILADVRSTSLALFVVIGQRQLPALLRHGWQRGTRDINALLARQSKALTNPFDIDWPEIAAFLRSRPRHYAALITETTVTGLREELAGLFGEGKGTEEMARSIDRHFTEISRTRARTIARTEVVSASARGSLASYEAAGPDVVAGKVWLATLDPRTRDAHAAVDGQERPVREPFLVDGVPMQHPGDPSAPPRLTANCRCALAPKVAGL